MPETSAWIAALRESTERLAAILEPLADDEVTAPSYDTEWTIADVASHLGSQAEIFSAYLEAGVNGTPSPGPETFPPVWDRWNALAPGEQVRQSIDGSRAFIKQVEQLSPAAKESFALSLFGRDVDLGGFIAMRVGEHALHVWDIAVALDSSATVSPDAVALLIDTLPPMAGYSGKASEGRDSVLVEATQPSRAFRFTLSPDVTMTPDDSGEPVDLVLPAEAIVRLVSGRLDAEHTSSAIAPSPLLEQLRLTFPGF